MSFRTQSISVAAMLGFVVAGACSSHEQQGAHPAAEGGGSGEGGSGGAQVGGEAGATNEGGTSEQPEGGASSGGAPGTAGMGGDAGAAGDGPDTTVPASPALPCGAECDAAGYACVQNECRGGQGALLWQHHLNERYTDHPGDIASDADGNAVVAFTTGVRQPTLGDEMIVRKFNPDGGQMWQHSFRGNRYGLLRAVALDSQGLFCPNGAAALLMAPTTVSARARPAQDCAWSME